LGSRVRAGAVESGLGWGEVEGPAVGAGLAPRRFWPGGRL